MPDITDLTIVLARDEALVTRPSAVRRKRRWALTKRCLRSAAALASETGPGRWTIDKDANSRPVAVADPPVPRPITLSLSHSGPFVVAAAAPVECLGIDLEVPRLRRFADIARFLEWPALTAASAPDNSDEFFPLWTLWEAAIKATSGWEDFDHRRVFADLATSTWQNRGPSDNHGDWTCHRWASADSFYMTVLACPTAGFRVRLYTASAGDAGSSGWVNLNAVALPLDSAFRHSLTDSTHDE
jgi:hypothetical protein